VDDVLEKIKAGVSFSIVKDSDLLGETSYQEFIFYVSETNQFFVQCLDWVEYAKCGFNTRRSVCFEKITDSEVRMRIELALEKLQA
jgi:hypothetical protein